MNRFTRALSLLALAALALVGAPAAAAVYVVDQAAPNSADTNPGTEEKPFRSVRQAVRTVRPGDTVYVMDGIYPERLEVTTSGTADRPITFESRPRHGAMVGGFRLAADHVRVVGFEITWAEPEAAVELAGRHCEVIGNFIHGMERGVTGTYGKLDEETKERDYSAVAHNRIAYNKVSGCQYGFILGGEDWLVENNEITRLFMYSPGVRYNDCDYTRFFGKGCVQRYNYYHGTVRSESKVAHVDAIQTFMNNGGVAQDVVFEFNTCFDFGQGAMIESAPYVGRVRNWTWRRNIYSSNLPTYHGAWGLDVIQTPDVTIENNTFVGVRWCGVGLRGKECTNGQIRNNLFSDSDRAVIDGDRHFTHAEPVVEHNLTFRTAPLAGETNTNGKDPLLVDPANRNFRLRKGSPAAAAGKDGAAVGALDYPNVYYVDPRHPAASDYPAWGYPAVPLATVRRAVQVAESGETIVLRGGVYREAIIPDKDGLTIRAMPGEKVVISGADLVQGWTRQADGSWVSEIIRTEAKTMLRDGRPWTEFTWRPVPGRVDHAGAVVVKTGGDPRLHVFESIVRQHGIVLDRAKNVTVEGIEVVNTLGQGTVRAAAEE